MNPMCRWIALSLFLVASQAQAYECTDRGGPPFDPGITGEDSRRRFVEWCVKQCGGKINQHQGCTLPSSGKSGAGATSGDLFEETLRYGVQTGDYGPASMLFSAQILGELMKTSPQDEARRRELLEQQKLESLRQAEERARQDEERKQRIQSQLKDAGTVELALKLEESAPLGIKRDDPPVSLAATSTARRPVAPPVPPVNLTTPGQQGIRDATECFEPRPALYCRNTTDRAACEKSYNEGFANGSIATGHRLRAAYDAGATFKRNGQPLPDPVPGAGSFNDMRAATSCRIKWVTEYNRGYAEAK